jgi:small subunit ribosomal protein S2
MSIDLRKLIQAGVPFGHPTSSWSPKMAPYIWGHKNKVYLIDVSKTAHQMQKAADFLKSVIMDGKSILWVGTKKPARDIIQATASALNCPYVAHRWIGGTLSNFIQVKKSVTKLLHYDDILSKTDHEHYTKKEISTLQKKQLRLKANIGGILNLRWPLGALVIVDVKKEQAALKEAAGLGIPVVALVDTNSDPSLVQYVIPANDDAPKSIKIIVDYLADSVKEAQQQAAAQGKKASQEVAVEASEKTDDVAVLLESVEDDQSVDNLKMAKVKKFKEPVKQKSEGPGKKS